MSLRLTRSDKYRLWGDLVRANTDRLFVETDEPYELGSTVSLEMEIAGIPVGTKARVVGLRRESRRFHAGVWVHIDDLELENCRRYLGLSKVSEGSQTGRRAARHRCSLKVSFTRPLSPDGGTVIDLSEHGLRLETPLHLGAGEMVELRLHLSDGASASLRGEVTRDDPAGRSVGVRFVDVSREAADDLRKQLEWLSKAEGRAKPTVVLIDDERAMLDFFQRGLTRHGYSIHRARTGIEALALIRELKPRLVVLDVMMPGLDGADLCRTMRSDVELAGIPVIFVSGMDRARLHEVAEGSGASDYLHKPVQLHELLNLVGSYLQA